MKALCKPWVKALKLVLRHVHPKTTVVLGSIVAFTLSCNQDTATSTTTAQTETSIGTYPYSVKMFTGAGGEYLEIPYSVYPVPETDTSGADHTEREQTQLRAEDVFSPAAAKRLRKLGDESGYRAAATKLGLEGGDIVHAAKRTLGAEIIIQPPDPSGTETSDSAEAGTSISGIQPGLNGALIFGAAYECGAVIDPALFECGEHVVQSLDALFDLAELGNTTNAYGCGYRQQRQEMLFCMATKLVEVAESLSPVVWKKLPGPNSPNCDVVVRDPTPQTPGDEAEWHTNIPNSLPPGPWIFPVQRPEDKFILRDQALRLVAQIATFEFNNPFLPTNIPGVRTCEALMTRAVNDLNETEYDGGVSQLLFEVSSGFSSIGYGGPSDISFVSRHNLAEHFLFRKTLLFRSATRLLRERLVERLVADDVAGGFSKKAQAASPAEGLKRLWGYDGEGAEPTISEDDTSRFNNLRHASSVLFGRLDGAAYPHGWFDIASFRARAQDVPPSSEQQGQAVELLSAAGILLPADAGHSGAQVREAVEAQLLERRASDVGILVGSPEYEQFAATSPLRAILATLADADIRFALNSNLLAYAQLKSEDPNALTIDPSNLGGGLTSGYLAEALEALGGATVDGGIPRQDLAVDISARLGYLERLASGVPLGQVLGAGIDAESNTPESRSNPFAVANLLRKRLVANRIEASRIGLAPTHNVVTTIDSIASEIESWTGPGQVVVFSTPGPSDKYADFQLALLGFNLEDLGVIQSDDLAESLVLVSGPPWVADCAAKLRTACPADFESDYVVTPTTYDVLDLDEEMQRILGQVAPKISLTFSGNGSAPKFDPIPNQLAEASNIYLVARRKSPTATQGRVLVTFNNPLMNSMSYTVSDVRREMANAALGVPEVAAGQAGEIGGITTGQPRDYCIEGIPHDMFVPLENELTSDNDEFEDSWQHYLNAAKEVADRTDALADRIVDLELEDGNRREAAQEQFANICGHFLNPDDITFSENEPVFSEGSYDDQQTLMCIDEPTYDIVFLTADQKDIICGDGPPNIAVPALPYRRLPGESQAACLKREVLNCPPPNGNGTGPNREACQKETVETFGLGIVPFPEGSAASTCDGLVDSIGNMVRGTAPFDETFINQLNGTEVTTKEGITQAVAALSTNLDKFGNWQLLLDGQAIANSSPDSSLWPGCLVAPTPCDPEDPDSPASVRLLDRLFNDKPSFVAGDKQDLLWRIQGALYSLMWIRAEAGAGRFVTQYPIATFTRDAQEFPFAAEIPAVFSSGEFSESSPGKFDLQLSEQNVPDPDGKVTAPDLLTGAETIEPSGTTFADAAFDYSGVPALPEWVQAVYADRGNYLHFKATSPELRFGNDSLTDETDIVSRINSAAISLKEAQCSGGWYGDATFVNSSGERIPVDFINSITLPRLNEFVNDGSSQRDSRSQKISLLRPDLSTGNAINYNLCGGGTDPGWLSLVHELDDQNRHTGTRVDFFPILEEECTSFDSFNCSRVFPWQVSVSRRMSQRYTCPFPNGDSERITHECARDSLTFGFTEPDIFTRSLLGASVCHPDARALGLVNTYPSRSRCEASAKYLGGIALACMALDPATPGAQFDLGSRPDIKSKDDLPGLERWFRNISGRLRRVTAGIYFENIPKRAIAEGLDPNVPVAKGDRATELADLGANIRALGYHWNSISDNLERFAGNINATYLEIQAIEADADFTRLQVKESSSPWIEAGFAVASVVLAANTGGVGSIALGYISAGTADYLVLGSAISKGALSVSSSVEEANKSSDLESLVNESEEAKLGLALNGLNDEAILKLGAVRDSFKGLQDAIPVINAKVGIVEQSERKAKYFLAKTAGQEGVVIDDQQVELVLNTIAGAEASSTRVRYETLVKEARVLAYLARLAIEQRIGTRLQDMDTTISNLDAPSTWVDDICILSGHDANEPFTLDLEEDDVKNTYLPDGGIEAFVEELHELFDVEGSSGEEAEREDLRYIGDYVQRLRNFMTLYNVQFPSRDSEDIAVLSMRDDILVSDLDDCLQSSPNLLYFSGNLAGGLNDVTEDGVPVVLGWQPGGCAAEGCVVASTLENIPLPAGIGGGASWLRDFSASAEEPTLPAPDAGAPNQGDVGVPRAIYQTLTLVPGSYVLSWWDQARGPTGLAHAVNDPLVDYRVAIVNPDLSTAQSVTLMPEASDWSGRRELRFKVEQTGLFSVAFYASAFLDQQGSLAIANVQLESVARPVDPPSAYVATTQSRLAFGGRCQSAEDFRNQWAYQCEGSRCFFELRHPFRIDTNDLASGLSPLEGQLAVGNFNYRHITNAINLVGTEVVDCEGTPSVSCFANAQLEYDLVHEAFDTILLDENGEGRHFDFGQGEINHGKALAAERLITSPLGSSDADLLSQPQFTKAEFGGRPLSGNYHLRIYDTPALRWDNVEDVQLIWNYRYWSRVQRSSGN